MKKMKTLRAKARSIYQSLKFSYRTEKTLDSLFSIKRKPRIFSGTGIHFLVILFIIIASIFTLKDLFKPLFYTSHDGIHQVVRLFYFDKLIKEGQIPPRFVGNLLNGFGYPLFNFSYHLPWIIAEPFNLLGFSIFESIKITFLLTFILSGIFMYIFQKEIYGKFAGFVGTFIYLYAPFRFSNIFVRAAIGDATIFILSPLLFLSLVKMIRANRLSIGWVILAAFSLFGLLVSHAMVSFFYFFSFGLFIFFNLIFDKNKKNILISSVMVLILSFLFSSYYLIPSITERNITNFSSLMNQTNVGQNYLKIKDLIYSSWGYGVMKAQQGAMSLQVGFAQWLSFALALIVFITLLFKKKKIDKISLFFILLFLLSIILMLDVSDIFWSSISYFVIVDFPWRILSLTVFSSAVLAGYAIRSISQKKLKVIISSLLIILAVYSNRNHLRINQVLDWPLSFYLKLEKTTNSYDEYTPNWVSGNIVEEPKPKAVFLKSNGTIKILKDRSNLLSLDINASKSGKIRINKIYYPGHKLFLNEKEHNFSYKNSGGVIEFDLPKGQNKVELEFRETPLRRISNAISLISGIIAISLLANLAFLKVKKRR